MGVLERSSRIVLCSTNSSSGRSSQRSRRPASLPAARSGRRTRPSASGIRPRPGHLRPRLTYSAASFGSSPVALVRAASTSSRPVPRPSGRSWPARTRGPRSGRRRAGSSWSRSRCRAVSNWCCELLGLRDQQADLVAEGEQPLDPGRLLADEAGGRLVRVHDRPGHQDQGPDRRLRQPSIVVLELLRRWRRVRSAGGPAFGSRRPCRSGSFRPPRRLPPTRASS